MGSRRLGVAVTAAGVAALALAVGALTTRAHWGPKGPRMMLERAHSVRLRKGRAAGIEAYDRVRREHPQSAEALEAGLLEANGLRRLAASASDPDLPLGRAESVAQWVFEQAPARSSVALQAGRLVVRIRLDRGNGRGAVDFVRSMSGRIPEAASDYSARALEVEALVTAGMPDEAIRAFERLEVLGDPPLYPGTYWQPVLSVIDAFEARGDRGAAAPYLRQVSARNPRRRVGKVAKVGRALVERDIPALIALLDDPEVAPLAAGALGRLGADAAIAVPRLRELARGEDFDAALAAEHALKDILGRD